MSKKLVSIIIPVFNEETNVSWFYKKLGQQISSISDFDFEVIFVDDGSKDSSGAEIEKIVKQDGSVRFISFSRNFGKEAATTAGLKHCKGQAAILLDVDGQHPVELIPKLLKEWENGKKVVVGVRKANTNEGFIKRYGSKVFYILINSLNGNQTEPGSTDFRLIDRVVIDEFCKLTEHGRITRGLIDWLGFDRSYVPFTAPARHSGTATYNYAKLVRLALHAFVSQSTKPLQLVGYLGFIATFVSAALGLILGFESYVLGDPLNLNITGTALLALFLSFLVGMVLICQWLLALYVESIHNETQNRPLFIIKDKK